MPSVAFLLNTMEENQRITKSFDFAADITKQLIALSTAIISLCVAFTDKIFSSDAARSNSTTLLIALVCFVASIILGIFTLMALAGHLGNPKNKKDDGMEQNPSPIYQGNVRCFSIGQMFLFIAAIIIAMVYVWKASSSTNIDIKPTQKVNTCLKVIRVSDYTIENNHIIDTLYLDSGLVQ